MREREGTCREEQGVGESNAVEVGWLCGSNCGEEIGSGRLEWGNV